MRSKFEHLLSVDPIGAFEKVKDNYKRYFQSAYMLRTDLSLDEDSAIDNERVKLLDTDDNLYKSPYLEMMPEYESAGIQSVTCLAKEYEPSFASEEGATLFFDFIKKGLMSYPPYGHQVEMLKKAFGEKHNAVITSGTGSGKTESFLLPLLAQIFKEALTWPQANYDAAWFVPQGRARTQYVPRQRSDKSRDAAIRAIVLYPMNALVEDQVRRLREALDSAEVRALMDEKLQKNRIFFGQYNGSTIGQKSYKLLQRGNVNKFVRAKRCVLQELNKLKAFYDVAQNELADPNCPDELKKDLEYITARLDGNTPTAEMLTRWDMQECPPDILITNVSMLSIMLMRSAEEDMIHQTKDWLAEDPWRKNEANEPTRIFHIVVDELHLYRGTAGSEVGCLLRMLLLQLGLTPVIEKDGKKIPNPQLRILASSASLGDANETLEFLQQFFGVYSEDEDHYPSFVVSEGTDYKPEGNSIDVPYDKFAEIDSSFVELSDRDQHDKMDKIMKSWGYESVEDFIIKHHETIFLDFERATHPTLDLSGIKLDELYGGGSCALFSNKESLRGFLIFRAYVDRYVKYVKKNESREIKHRLPRFRFHQFFKYIEGLWGELNPTLDDNGQAIQEEPVVNLAYQPKEVGPNHGNRMLELLRCECCGQLYIGGNVDRSKNRLHLSLNVPDLDKIPSFNPTPMVQNKSYDEYAIFYPTHNKNVQLDDQENRCTNINDMTVNESARVEWKRAYLIPKTGEIKEDCQPNSVEGYICQVSAGATSTFDGKTILALPCTCPHCHMDYQYREYTKSPIRSFRTGIDRSNQILSKELLYQLSTPKLIGFSDSREDAAKQSYGIANEHYRDMVRVLFIEQVEERIKSMNAVDPNKKLDEVINRIDQLKSQGLVDSDDIMDMIDSEYGDEGYKWAHKYLNGKTIPRIPFTPVDVVSIEGFADKNGPLVKALLETGVNPDGVSTAGGSWWSDAYHYYRTDGTMDDATYLLPLATTIFNNSFGLYMGVSVTDTGIGYLCVNPKRLANECNQPQIQELERLLNGKCDVQEFLDSFLRVMGDCYRFQSPQGNLIRINGYPSFRSAMKRYVARVADRIGCDKRILGDILYRSMAILGFNGMELRIPSVPIAGADSVPELAFRVLDPDKSYYYCSNCHRIHPIKGVGICTRCGSDLESSTRTNKDLWKHYISHDIEVERRIPCRLHTEELTGQTDDIQERLRLFKNLVLASDNDTGALEGRKKTQPIDMISVTTTMEVGVDIGSLEAIYQGNMSPTRYNYQQRVGRGGRRGQAFATAFTFCRGRSHDLYYYEKATERIVGEKPATPKLSLAPYEDLNGWHIKRSIMKRVIAKHILRNAITDMYDPDLHDTVAEFGKVANWSDGVRDLVVNKLKEKDFATDIVDYYISQFNTPSTDISADLTAIRDWAQDVESGLVKNIDDVVNSYHDSEVGLGQCLAEMGILPKYGMPFDVRDLYHGYNERNNTLCTIDRPSEMAITEFAPGAEKTKDKGIYVVEGICVPMMVDHNGDPQYIDQSADALENRYIVKFDSDQNITDIDPCTPDPMNSISLNDNEKVLVIPKAYRTRVIQGNRGARIDNNDRRTRFAGADIFAKEGSGTSKAVRNCVISAFGFSDNEAEIWHVNTNNLRFYRGNYGGLDNPPTDGDTTTYAFDISNNDGVLQPGQHLIALGSRKVTEMICLQLKNYPSCLDLNCATGNRAAIRAAYISAAFLLQRTLADLLDVEPREIEVIEKIKDNKPLIYLSDALPNGAGIVEYLYQENHLEEVIGKIINFDTPFMQSLIDDDGHKRKCLTACQECLNAYDNRGYHHVLDWRMGVGLLRLMIDPDYDFGFNPANRSKSYPELEDYSLVFNAAAKKMDGSWENDLYSLFRPTVHRLLNPHARSETTCKVLYHPLWKRDALTSSLPVADKYEYHNIFKVLRSDLTPDHSQTAAVAIIPPVGTPGAYSVVTEEETDPITSIITGIDLS